MAKRQADTSMHSAYFLAVCILFLTCLTYVCCLRSIRYECQPTDISLTSCCGSIRMTTVSLSERLRFLDAFCYRQTSDIQIHLANPPEVHLLGDPDYELLDGTRLFLEIDATDPCILHIRFDSSQTITVMPNSVQADASELTYGAPLQLGDLPRLELPSGPIGAIGVIAHTEVSPHLINLLKQSDSRQFFQSTWNAATVSIYAAEEGTLEAASATVQTQYIFPHATLWLKYEHPQRRIVMLLLPTPLSPFPVLFTYTNLKRLFGFSIGIALVSALVKILFLGENREGAAKATKEHSESVNSLREEAPHSKNEADPTRKAKESASKDHIDEKLPKTNTKESLSQDNGNKETKCSDPSKSRATMSKKQSNSSPASQNQGLTSQFGAISMITIYLTLAALSFY
jgi:hypothetical protein